MRGISGQKNTVYPEAINHPHIRTIQRQPCGVVQPDIRSAGPFTYDLLKTFQGWIVWFVHRNLGLKLERIRAWQWAEREPPGLVLRPGVPVVPIQSIDSNIRNQHSLGFPCFTFEAHTEFFSNEAVSAVGANQVSRKNLLGPTGMDQRGGHAITILFKAG